MKNTIQRRCGVVFGQLAINGVGKSAGFAREVLISSMFGVSAVTDAFFAIQQLLVFASSYMMGAFNLAFVPAYIRNRIQGTNRKFLKPVLLVLIIIGLTISTILLILDESQFAIILGFPVGSELLPRFGRILAWAVVPTVMIGVAFGVLHAERRHQSATLLGATSSFGMLGILLCYYFFSLSADQRLVALPWSYLGGSLIAAVAAALVLLNRLNEKPAEAEAELRPFVRALGASSIENVGFNINQLSNVYFAARMGEGLVAINAFAFRVGMLPLALVSSQLGQIYQSWAARVLAQGRRPAKSVFFLLCLSCAVIAVALALWGEAIVRLVYERGTFTSAQTAQVAELMLPYSAYFFVMSVNQLAARHSFVFGNGSNYAYLMLGAYASALLVKVTLVQTLDQIIWTCVVAEGLVAVWLCSRIALDSEK